MILAAAVLAVAAVFGAEACQCPGFRCEISGVETFEGKVTCRHFCPPGDPEQLWPAESQENLREFLDERRQHLVRLYSVLGYLDARVEFEVFPSNESPVLKLRVTEGDMYRIERIEILTDRPQYDSASLRKELVIHEGQVCNVDWVKVSAFKMRARGRFKSSDYDILKSPRTGRVIVRIRLSDEAR